MGKVIYAIQAISTVLCFMYSLKLFKSRFLQPGYMKLFRFYPLVALSFQIAGYCFYVSRDRFYEYTWVNQFSIVFHFLLLAIVIIAIHERSKINIRLRLFGIISLILILTVIPYDPLPGSGWAFFSANSALVILGISYFKSLYNSEQLSVLKFNPGYLITSGTTVGLGITLPYFAVIWYLKDKAEIHYVHPLMFVSILGYVIMQFFFIKAMKCTTIHN